MKKYIIFFLYAAILLSLCACTAPQQQFENPVSFYYPRVEYQYGQADGVIAAEDHEGDDDLSRLLTEYLKGPRSEELRSPFPAGTKLVQLERDGSTLQIVLNANFAKLSGIDLTIACACITKTCLELTDATSVQISAEDSTLNEERSITMDENSLLLMDNTTLETTDPTETQEEP